MSYHLEEGARRGVTCDKKGCRRFLKIVLWVAASRESDGWRQIDCTTGIVQAQHTCPIHTLDLELWLEAASAPEKAIAALKSWVDFWDNELASDDPNDPIIVIRQQVHGPRIAQTRAALALLTGES